LLNALVSNQDVFSERIDTQTTTITALHENTVSKIIQHQESLPDRIAEAFEKSILENTEGISFEAHKDRAKDHTEQVDRAVLRCLKFSTMNDRYDRVADAHKKTFEWIFRNPNTWNKPWNDFSHWLSHGEGIYWVSGKAGSGKSTLMRYLVESATTQGLLEQWTGMRRLTTASFFFWNGGASDQASQTGLLRSLLHEILDKNRKACPHLIRLVFPDEWADAEDAVLPKRQQMTPKQQFPLGRLQKAFRILAKQDIGRICLFIDGLDEFDGDIMDMAHFFRQISSANIKLCLSSRPWVVFEEAFEQQPKLRLQDLTFNDIEIYVNDNLFSNSRMKGLYAADPVQASQLVKEIVTKASGVFLWVMLVVRDLLKGLTYHDKIPALQRQIEALPSELQDLYNTTVGQIEPSYLQEGSRILQMMSLSRTLAHEAAVSRLLCRTESLCAVGLSFVMEEENLLPEGQSIKFLTLKDISERVFEVDCRLKVCCSGLLEVSGLGQGYLKHDQTQDSVVRQYYENTKIRYLHRTVKDFVESPEMQDRLRRYTEGTRFDAYTSLLTSSVLRVRNYMFPQTMEAADWLTNIVDWCMMLAREHEIKAGRCEVELLDELDRVASLAWKHIQSNYNVSKSPHSTISSRLLTAYSISTVQCQADYLSLATVYDLSMYLDARLGSTKQPQRAIMSSRYLEYAIVKSPMTLPGVDRVPDAKTIKVLVQHGANSVPQATNTSPVEKVLKKVSKMQDKEDLALKWAPILELLLIHGCNQNRWAGVSLSTPRIQSRRARQIIAEVYSKNLPDVAKRLLETLVAEEQGVEIEWELVTATSKQDEPYNLPWLTGFKSSMLTW
jgi:hypothetical protein